MGAIIAVVNKNDENVAKTAVTMLNTLKQKHAETFGLASPTTVMMGNSIGDFRGKQPSSPVLVGRISSRIFILNVPQPMKLDNGTFVFEGRVYSPSMGISSVELAAEKMNQNLGNAEPLIKDFEGDFAFAVAEPGKLVVGRDSLGAYPLYYGENADLAALASERKALLKIGIEEVHSFPPGYIAIVDKHGFNFKRAKTLVSAKTKQITMQNAAERKHSFLQRLSR